MKTYSAKPHEVEAKWYLIDAEGQTLGRLATKAAHILRGKHKVTYTPHVDCGDYVIVLNSDKVVLTGKKLTDKKMRWHTGYVGGLKEVDYGTLIRKNSVKAVEKAIKGMLPKTSLGRKQFTRLHVYKDGEHNNQAQKPETIQIKGARN